MNLKKAKHARKVLGMHFNPKVPVKYADIMSKDGQLMKRTVQPGTFRSAYIAYKKEERQQHLAIRFR